VRASAGGRRGSIFTVSIYTDQPSSACIRKTRTKLLGCDVARRPGRRGATGGGKKRIAKEMAKVLALLAADDRRRCNNTYCYTNDALKSFVKVDSPPRGVASPRPDSATSRPRLESGHCETLVGSHASLYMQYTYIYIVWPRGPGPHAPRRDDGVARRRRAQPTRAGAFRGARRRAGWRRVRRCPFVVRRKRHWRHTGLRVCLLGNENGRQQSLSSERRLRRGPRASMIQPARLAANYSVVASCHFSSGRD
jgi:hypothetical protein